MKRSRVIASSSPFPWRFSNGMLQGTFSLSLVLGAFVFLYFNVSLLHMHQAKEENDGINNVNNVPPSSPSTAFDKSNNERYFLPGSLPMNRTETLHKCYFPVSNKLPTIQGCTISEKYKIIFYMTPKAGSSTGRHVVKNDFEGVDHEVRCRIPEGENESEWIQMAVLRNPTTRAFASYEEMFVRHLGRVQHIPERFRRFMIPFQDFIYLNYSALFDNAAGVAKLNEAYETFMQDWDGTSFDVHLLPQVDYSMRFNGVRYVSDYLTEVFDTHNMEDAFREVAKRVKLGKIPKVIRGRAYPRRLNVSHVSERAFRKMCRFYARDYCCLNYPLPKHCLLKPSEARGRNETVACVWREVNKEMLIDYVLV